MNTVTEKDIGWGKYREFEGPFFRGRLRYALPASPDFLDKCLYVITATEGGSYDAVNMYDRCILSVGLIQWCERNLSFSAILGRCADVDSFMVDNALKSFPGGIHFKKNAAGKWRFFAGDLEVDNEARQRLAFLGASNVGKVGTWQDLHKSHAKKVAACMANIWEFPLFRLVQAEATKTKLLGFALPEAKALLFEKKGMETEFHWPGALRAMFLSFAANNPTIANRCLQKAAAHPDWKTADAADRFRLAAQVLTFGAGVDIYPHRYEAIAPVLTKTFGIQIPLKSAELKEWDDAPPETVKVELSELEKQIAARLIRLADETREGRGIGLDAIETLMEEPDDAGPESTPDAAA